MAESTLLMPVHKINSQLFQKESTGRGGYYSLVYPKRGRQPQQPRYLMSIKNPQFVATDSSLVIEELHRTLLALSQDQVEVGLELILGARRVFFTGAGRSGLALRMAAMRMMHLGLTAYAVGEVVTPAINKADLLVVASGSGTTAGPVHAADVARKAGADVLAITTAPGSALGVLARAVITIPAAVKHGDNSGNSKQYAGTLFEQTVLLLMDILFHEMWHRRGEATELLWKRHANLE